MSRRYARKRMQPLVAWRALRSLLDNPERTEDVFTIIDALSGPSLERGLKKFRKTPVGNRVLEENIDLLETLGNRDYLATLQANSLGAAYLKFVTSENLSADGLVEASETGALEEADTQNTQEMHPDLVRFGNRQRDMHDLWHTVTQYGRDELGEACLLAFTYAQTKNRGIGLICIAGTFKLRPHYGSDVFKAIWRGYRDGKKAGWLPAADWEHLLTLPIDEVRRTLNIDTPVAYQSLRAMDFAPA